jgi:hypothetical protein
MKPPRPETRTRLGRVPLLALGILSLLAGIWGGLLRLPVNLPLLVNHANWITYHGPLMVGGFLGTLIGLERAVGLRVWWAYTAPLLTGAGAVLLRVLELESGGGSGIRSGFVNLPAQEK